jgi:hypothetical protein
MDITNKKGSSTTQALCTGSTLSALVEIMLTRWGSHVTKGAAVLRCCGAAVLRCCGAAVLCQESHVSRRLCRAAHGTSRYYQMSALQSSLIHPLKHWSKLPNTAPPPRVLFHKQTHTSAGSPSAHRRAQLHTQPTCIATAFFAASKSMYRRLNGWSLDKLRVRAVMRRR